MLFKYVEAVNVNTLFLLLCMARCESDSEPPHNRTLSDRKTLYRQKAQPRGKEFDDTKQSANPLAGIKSSAKG